MWKEVEVLKVVPSECARVVPEVIGKRERKDRQSAAGEAVILEGSSQNLQRRAADYFDLGIDLKPTR